MGKVECRFKERATLYVPKTMLSQLIYGDFQEFDTSYESNIWKIL